MNARLLVALLLASCSDGFPEGSEPPVAPDVDPDAVPEIIAFSATPAPVAPHNPVELSWEVKNARTVEIFDADATLINTFEAKGNIRTQPLRRDRKYFLRATNRDKTASAELVVNVDWPLPVIIDFSAGNPVLIGAQLHVFWRTSHADLIRVELDGVEEFREEVEERGGMTSFVITKELTHMRFIAWNQSGEAVRELDIRGHPAPVITRFAIQPRVLLTGIPKATVHWATLNGGDVDMLVTPAFGGTARGVPGFPDSHEGTMETIFNGPAIYELVVLGPLSSLEQKSVRVDRPPNEQEPNDVITSPNFLETGMFGAIDPSGDVDTFELDLDQVLSGLRIYTLSRDGLGCDADTKITGRTYPGSIFGVSGGPGNNACELLELSQAQVEAARLDGDLIIVVEGEDGTTGPYALLTEEM